MIVTSIPWDQIILGQADAASAVVESASQVRIDSVWDFVKKGGPMMIPIVACSLVALAVTAERLISLRRGQIIPPNFLAGLKKAFGPSGSDKRKALAYCQSDKSPVADILAAGIKRLDEPVERLEKHIQDAGERVVIKLRKYLRILSVIASISPLLGLLGTMFGMITAFQTVAVSGEALGKTELLAKGIYEAMITTAAGLLVCIPVIVCYNFISARIDRLVLEMDQMTVEFVEEFGAPNGVGQGTDSRAVSGDSSVPVGAAAAAS
ncbi:MAG: MotA/TolQ/ExbB proton channel family protein [Planctomycetota bacterium]|nr:MotA/TolQ/ExbB proton channel family protein [Planctomycetota bacterium]